MKRFYQKITHHPKTVILIFIVAAVFSLICKQFINVDYDMNHYLPEDSASTTAINVMEDQFDGGIPNARVMLSNVTTAQALEFKDKLKSIDGVTDVTWLDDSEDMSVPIETMDQSVVENYYKDGDALFTVTMSEDKRIDATNAIKAMLGDDDAITGSAVTMAVATTNTVTEISRIVIFAVAFVLLVLVLTTSSWVEPFTILLGLGVAIAINAGTNLIFGTISFVTNAAGSILQLGVSLDYSVFLLHRFNEMRRADPQKDVRDVMTDALLKSEGSILASGLTTVIGFLALCLMRFRIGPDLGLALAKGIAISLITAFTFMPALMIVTSRLADKYRHKKFVPSFNKFGRFVCKIMFPMVIVFAIVTVPAYLASNSNSYYYGASHIFGTQTRLGQDTEKIENIFGKKDTYVLMVPKGDLAKETELSNALHQIPEVSDIISYVDNAGASVPYEYVDSDTLSKLESNDYSRMVLTVNADYEGAETFSLVKTIRSTADQYYPGTWYLAGEGVSTYDLMDTVTNDMVSVNLIAIGAVALVLILTMKNISLPIILVLSIESAIWLNVATPYFAGYTVFYIAYLIISSIQLGATVDYAILFTDRYREFRETYDKKEAVRQTVSATAVSIMTSASVLTVVGFLMGMISTHGLISQLGYFLGRGTLYSLAVVLFVLPGLLYIFDRIVVSSKEPKAKRARHGRRLVHQMILKAQDQNSGEH